MTSNSDPNRPIETRMRETKPFDDGLNELAAAVVAVERLFRGPTTPYEVPAALTAIKQHVQIARSLLGLLADEQELEELCDGLEALVFTTEEQLRRLPNLEKPAIRQIYETFLEDQPVIFGDLAAGLFGAHLAKEVIEKFGTGTIDAMAGLRDARAALSMGMRGVARIKIESRIEAYFARHACQLDKLA